MATQRKKKQPEASSEAKPQLAATKPFDANEFHKTKFGTIYLGDSQDVIAQFVQPKSVDLIITSPPFGLVRKKDYGNADSHEYLDWFRPFGHAFKRVLKDTGSLVIDIGGAWIPEIQC